MKSITEYIKNHIANKLPFVVYNKPNETEVLGLFQHTDSLHILNGDFDGAGFVFAPFSNDNPTVFFPLKNAEFVKGNLADFSITMFNDMPLLEEGDKESHLKLVKKGVLAIENEEFKKVVLSRSKTVNLSKHDITEIYSRLLATYPNAFVYIWYHPAIGLWVGATPETLLELKDNCFATMSLAGTQVFQEGEETMWSEKEIDEQKIVTDYIVAKLSHFTTDLQQSETKTVRAGSLVHLRTEIQGVLNEQKENALYGLVDLLHPTPAVCGFPKEPAKQFILEHENYKRKYYTGFLGELNMGKQLKRDSHLFVNLRCMELKENEACVYIGGGITIESDAEKEWKETVAKSNIMLKVL